MSDKMQTNSDKLYKFIEIQTCLYIYIIFLSLGVVFLYTSVGVPLVDHQIRLKQQINSLKKFFQYLCYCARYNFACFLSPSGVKMTDFSKR